MYGISHMQQSAYLLSTHMCFEVKTFQWITVDAVGRRVISRDCQEGP